MLREEKQGGEEDSLTHCYLIEFTLCSMVGSSKILFDYKTHVTDSSLFLFKFLSMEC